MKDVRKHSAPIPIADTAPWFADRPLQDLVDSPTNSLPNADALTAEGMHAELERQGLPRPK